MNFELSAREKELARKGREFCEQVLVPLEIETDEHGELPMKRREEVKQAVRDWGLAGINHSKENGGLGLTMVEQTAIE
jgi:alkylation response protein AidB-like acyl-CoA dehydrogenase